MTDHALHFNDHAMCSMLNKVLYVCSMEAFVVQSRTSSRLGSQLGSNLLVTNKT